MNVAANELREAKFDYGVLPVPKYDEAQENYRSTHAYTSGSTAFLWCEKSGYVLRGY